MSLRLGQHWSPTNPQVLFQRIGDTLVHLVAFINPKQREADGEDIFNKKSQQFKEKGAQFVTFLHLLGELRLCLELGSQMMGFQGSHELQVRPLEKKKGDGDGTFWEGTLGGNSQDNAAVSVLLHLRTLLEVINFPDTANWDDNKLLALVSEYREHLHMMYTSYPSLVKKDLACPGYSVKR
jgi:hypothetical protein